MKNKIRAAQKKLPLDWAEESYKVSVQLRPRTTHKVSVSLTEFIRRDVTCTGNPALRAAVPDGSP